MGEVAHKHRPGSRWAPGHTKEGDKEATGAGRGRYGYRYGESPTSCAALSPCGFVGLHWSLLRTREASGAATAVAEARVKRLCCAGAASVRSGCYRRMGSCVTAGDTH